MTIEIFSLDYDSRLAAYCVNARCEYQWFLEKTTGAEDNLKIQRQIIKGSKPYATLRADLKRGCILPAIVLALKNIENAPSADTIKDWHTNNITNKEFLNSIRDSIDNISTADVYIIDGLQRTNAIRQTADELIGTEKQAFLKNRIRLELWINIPFGALAYRMLLLNAGQKPMSMKHQVEILSMKLQEELSCIPKITIYTSLEGRRRTQAGQFHLSKLAQAFQAWLQGQPTVDLKNLVMEQLLAESAIETLGSSLSADQQTQANDSFVQLVTWFVNVDFALPSSKLDFLSNETVLQGIAAAVGTADKNPSLKDRKDRALRTLLASLISDPDSDPFGIDSFISLRQGIDPSRVNVGQATRDMVYRTFREYFLADGTKPMSECWQFGAA
ncbi:hypothetical protein [Acidithiobacillus ferriphilus]|uniref:hypothetical protein n=1 Tax=Acidithiobacillus ferriphilus TaxID=1689834 RepID=UPI001C0761FC|nr:hypothetical protein [Acidithiobacillus ferriphilus]MBU2828696.1 hypothetical protein [Acidithiobacillus ferriphilus]